MITAKGFTINETSITQMFNNMLSRTKLADGWLNRVAVPLLYEVQRQRWMTENTSEGDQWAPLNPVYARYKLKRYGGGPKRDGGTWPNYPGSGTKLMIATGRLVDSMSKPGGDGVKMVQRMGTTTRLTLGTLLDYAKYPNATRNFTDLSQSTVDNITEQYVAYVKGGS